VNKFLQMLKEAHKPLMQIHCVEELLPHGLSKEQAKAGFALGDTLYGAGNYKMLYDGVDIYYEKNH